MEDERYVPVWQTWNVIHVAADSTKVSESTPSSSSSTIDLRRRMQVARIQRRWSVTDLAARVGCDANLLSAFERGDEILHASMQAAIKDVLQL